jgi:hypothetical protein
MQDIYDFMIAFRDAEHAAYRAMLLEPDYERFRQIRQSLEAFAPAIRLSSQIVRNRNETIPPEGKAQQELERNYSPRVLLRLESYTLPQGHTLYAAYMTGTNTSRRTGQIALKTRLRYFVEAMPDGFQIVGFQHAPNSAFPYWETTGGQDITLPNEPDEVVVYREEE